MYLRFDTNLYKYYNSDLLLSIEAKNNDCIFTFVNGEQIIQQCESFVAASEYRDHYLELLERK